MRYVTQRSVSVQMYHVLAELNVPKERGRSEHPRTAPLNPTSIFRNVLLRFARTVVERGEMRARRAEVRWGTKLTILVRVR